MTYYAKEAMARIGYVFYDPPSWKSRHLAVRATLAVLPLRPSTPLNRLEPAGVESQWLDSATSLLRQLQHVPDGVDVPSHLTRAIQGVTIGLSNVGGAGVGSALATAHAVLGRPTDGPDHTWLPVETFTRVVLPLRVIDATEWLDYQRAPPAVRPDILAAFEAIWLAREFAAAYAYVEAVVKSGEWTP